MTNPQGTPIWYELITPDPDGAKAFYDAAVGWTIEAQPSGPIDYRMIDTGNGLVGGVLRMDDGMKAAGGKPGWLLYVGVDDVDATFEQAKGLGAAVHVPPTDIPGVGRFALLADPQGASFYIMRGASEESSTVFSPTAPGHCSWNELWTTDHAAAIAFYGALFGWENRETMDMGPMGGYRFIDLSDVRLGAIAGTQEARAAWNVYFRSADLDASIEAVKAGGGTVDQGPHQVPGGDRIIIGTDPQGARFSLVGQ